MSNPEIKRFFKKAFRFFLFFVILSFLISITILGIPMYIFFGSGEATNQEKLIGLQNEKNSLVLYGAAYSNQVELYKTNLVNSRKHKIVALGSSRIMQMRDHFFRSSFCNAGGGATKINEFKAFLEHIEKDKKPEILLLALDQYIFNSNWDNGGETKLEKYTNEVNYLLTFHANIFQIYSDYAKGKVDLKKIIDKNPDLVGLTATLKKSGFRNDGSYLYGDVIKMGGIKNKDHYDHNFKDTLSRIEKGEMRFEYGNQVSDYSLEQLDQLLKYCAEEKIKVVAFLPPFPEKIWEEFKERENEYSYIFEIFSKIAPLFDKYNFEVYDFSDAKELGSSSCEVIDGLHCSEKTYLRISKFLAQRSKILENELDLDVLSTKLSNTNNCFTVEK